MTDKKAILKNFLTEYGVVVVDNNPSSRLRLQKVVSDLGAKKESIFPASSIKEVEEVLAQHKIGLVLSEYDIGGGSGFDLFKKVRSTLAFQKNLVQILVTSNATQTTVAKAAEEDVDSFIIKPYTLQSIQENLIAAITFKISPPPYIVKIEEGKALLKKQDMASAYAKFEEAFGLHTKPSLALFYMGMTKCLMIQNLEAKNKYQSGLTINNLHYKCLVGLFDLYIQEKNYSEAYEIVKKIAQYFPANPDRLMQIIKLVVQTQNFNDLLSYYDFFTQLEVRPTELCNSMGAGLYVAGRYFLMNNQKDLALNHFEKLAISCSDQTKFLKGIMTTLAEYQHFDLCGKFITRFNSEQKKSVDYLICDFIFSCLAKNNPQKTLDKAKELHQNKIREPIILKAIITSLKSLNKLDEVHQYTEEFERLYPDKIDQLAA